MVTGVPVLSAAGVITLMTPAVSRAEEPAGVDGVVQGLLCGVEVAVGGVAEQNLTVFHQDEKEVDRERFCHKRQSI
jgi:hypothetical protein